MSSTCSFASSSSRKAQLTNLESKIDSWTIAEATALCFSIFDLERSTSRKFHYTPCSAALSISFVTFSKGQSSNQSRFVDFITSLRDFSRFPQKTALHVTFQRKITKSRTSNNFSIKVTSESPPSLRNLNCVLFECTSRVKIAFIVVISHRQLSTRCVKWTRLMQSNEKLRSVPRTRSRGFSKSYFQTQIRTLAFCSCCCFYFWGQPPMTVLCSSLTSSNFVKI